MSMRTKLLHCMLIVMSWQVIISFGESPGGHISKF